VCRHIHHRAKPCNGGWVSPEVSTSLGEAGWSWERQTDGPGKYASAEAGWKTMCGTIPVRHCPASRLSNSAPALRVSQRDRPIATKVESQFHWWG
jgi:hypothetical protein